MEKVTGTGQVEGKIPEAASVPSPMQQYGRGLMDGLKGSEENRPFGGRKDDGGKIRYELLAPDFLRAVATILTFGAKKYKDWNWAEGFEWSRLYGATQRHLNAWWDGEAKDPETSYSHLWHAGCCIMFLVVHEIRGLGKDDRHVWKLREARKAPGLEAREEVIHLCTAEHPNGDLCIYVEGHKMAAHRTVGGKEFD